MYPRDIRKKILAHVDKLQEMMETNAHLSDPATVGDQISICSGYFHVLDEEDREYLQMARDAVEEGREWKV